jgi:hypothetical protein
MSFEGNVKLKSERGENGKKELRRKISRIGK